MPGLIAASATRQPILLSPITPRLCPASSYPAYAFFPASIRASSSGAGDVQPGHEAQRSVQVAGGQQQAGQDELQVPRWRWRRGR